MTPIEILGKLKTIFQGKFGDILSNNKFVLFDFSRNSNDTIEVKDEKSITVDISKANPEEQKQIKEELLDELISEDEAILLNKSKINTELIKQNLPDTEDEALLKYYKDKLTPTMHKVLEAALVVRNAHKNQEDISGLKAGIARKYPDIGNNMCNLVTSDYFHGHFKELFESMLEEENFEMFDYQDKVKYIVKSLPYIVFVNQYKTYEEINAKMKFKLEKLKKYGAGKLVLHALSKVNVDKALRMLKEYKDETSMRIEIDMNPAKTRITANLIF